VSRLFSASRVARFAGVSRETLSRHIRVTGIVKPDFHSEGKFYFVPENVPNVKRVLDENRQKYLCNTPNS
jgi:hypothetical protein